jgi:hypothetical protein
LAFEGKNGLRKVYTVCWKKKKKRKTRKKEEEKKKYSSSSFIKVLPGGIG